MAYEQAQTVMQREKPEVDPSREALCKEWQEKVREAKNFWRDDFERMRKSSRYVRGKQWPRQTKDDERYIANITHRHVQQRTAALYAKNPRAVAKPRPRLNYMLWDGNEQTAMMAEQGAAAAMQGGMMPDPQTAALLQDIAAGKQHKDMIDRIGKTLEIVFAYQLSEPKPKFKPQAKQAVRRCLTTGVAHLKLGYQRVAQYPPAIESQIQDVSKQLAEIERLAADVADREIEPDDAEMEQLRLMLIDLQASDKILLRDGLVFGFPKSTSIIVDPACTQLKGFVGAGWVAEEFCLTPNEVKRRYKIDIGKEFSQHAEASNKRRQGKNKPSWALVWEIYDLDNHLRHVVCDGYCDFLEADGSPDITLEQFHPYFTLTFNDIEDGYAGEGDFNADPMFLDSGEHPYRLRSDSPCINAGPPDIAGLRLPAFDLAGAPRVWNGRLDVGAYEWSDPAGIGTDAAPPAIAQLQIAPNPGGFGGAATILTFDLNRPAQATLTVYDAAGRLVVTLLDAFISAGRHEVRWDGSEPALDPGAYFCRLTVGGREAGTTKLLHLAR